MKTQRMVFGIRGLGFLGAGADEVQTALASTAGVDLAYVDRATEMAYVQYDPLKLGPEDLIQKVRGTGYGVEAPIVITP